MTSLGAQARGALSTELDGRARRRSPLFTKQSWIHIGAHQESPGHDRRDKDKKQELEKQRLDKQEREKQEFEEHEFEKQDFEKYQLDKQAPGQERLAFRGRLLIAARHAGAASARSLGEVRPRRPRLPLRRREQGGAAGRRDPRPRSLGRRAGVSAPEHAALRRP